ncbi:hypothetical protein Y900_011915 [Mycolicibacterium aromaticivorans JS19b1 = JCM 16368]|uniref:Uncharacterized protein n=1 Tax=Mycolicibacterium aromaticivorans JS19b1 = JCM 16368 TaxID=1440774 RepID=A0A064CIX1_9MYCO|nr:hypothetical protein [Mycolicibacterium aromaticivorans]KDE99626.1 hypothetical protein Y900_011915 [Mycolicibacterium aromaticivorans JS19b1 = JCM 16368]
MTVHERLVSAGLVAVTSAAIMLSAAATASADDAGSGLLWPDPTEPYYWDDNENPGSTGPAPLPTDDLYWKEGQDAGGTGNAAQPSGPEYTDEGQNAGAV